MGRSIQNKNIIIVCEGSTTEYNYFCEIRRFLIEHDIIQEYELRIIPDGNALIDNTHNKRHRSFMGNRLKYQYYEMAESNEQDYKKYCKQPTRYVREAQLFCDEGTYAEGWAVYDKDQHPAPQEAEILLKSDNRLSAAFSAYSFEEWLLLHFEYNDSGFIHSECKKDNQECRCGTIQANKDYDCKGTKCLGGALRQKKYIPNYSKKDKNLFSTYTYKKENNDLYLPAFINAARLRTNALSQYKDRISCEAYTDVDYLVLHLLKDNKTFDWKPTNEIFTFEKYNLKVHRTNNLVCVENLSQQSYLFNPEKLFFCDEIGSNLVQVSAERQVIPGQQQTEPFSIQQNKFLMFKSSTEIIIIEL